MAKSGVGTKFAKRTSAAGATTEVYTLIAEIKSIDGPSSTRAFHDSTSLDSTGGWRTYIPGFKDVGTVSLVINYTASGYSTLLSDMGSDTASKYKITLPDTTTIVFDAFITDVPLSIPEDIITMNVTLRVTGEPVVTFPSGS